MVAGRLGLGLHGRGRHGGERRAFVHRVRGPEGHKDVRDREAQANYRNGFDDKESHFYLLPYILI